MENKSPERQSLLTVEPPFAVLGRAPAPGAREHSLSKIVDRCTRDIVPTESFVEAAPIWSAEFFRLGLSKAYRELGQESQARIVSQSGTALLNESLMIEVAGMTFAAKMTLMAETLAQRELYSHFAADEANHFRMIASIVGQPHETMADTNPFLQFLSKLIETETRGPLVLLIQVVLEGWGIPHYSNLAENALNPEIGQTLHRIVQDEARHHGSGLLIFEESKMSALEMKRLESYLGDLLAMLRLGPAGVVGTLAPELGGMSKADIQRFLEETSFEKKLGSDLALMRGLLTKAGAHRLLERIQTHGLLEVPQATDVATSIHRMLNGAA